jgi:hypothetical protein
MMKTKGLRKSKNVQDARARGVGSNDLPSNLSVARDRKKAEKFWDGKGATASKGKMAKDAGIDGIEKKKKLPSKDGNVYKGKR